MIKIVPPPTASAASMVLLPRAGCHSRSWHSRLLILPTVQGSWYYDEAGITMSHFAQEKRTGVEMLRNFLDCTAERVVGFGLKSSMPKFLFISLWLSFL